MEYKKILSAYQYLNKIEPYIRDAAPLLYVVRRTKKEKASEVSPTQLGFFCNLTS